MVASRRSEFTAVGFAPVFEEIAEDGQTPACGSFWITVWLSAMTIPPITRDCPFRTMRWLSLERTARTGTPLETPTAVETSGESSTRM